MVISSQQGLKAIKQLNDVLLFDTLPHVKVNHIRTLSGKEKVNIQRIKPI